jgi:diaminopropionate ammonia-lyase
MQFFENPHSSRDAYSTDEARIISASSALEALNELNTWPGYAVSELRDLSHIASRLGLQSVLCKDETHRFGLGSFKALGGAYAAGRALKRRAPQEVRPTLCCATDGNHGRSVAFAARRFGCPCIIFVHKDALHSKVVAMQSLGAKVVRIPGNYDDSVHCAKRSAAANGWILISDTSDSAADRVAAEVMQGYSVIGLELLDQLKGSLPTHLFLQAGVGGLAAAIAGCFAEMTVNVRPTIIVVEPESAACVMQSARAEGLSRVDGDLATNMAMLSAGETSAPAWVILSRRADAFMTVSDEAAAEAAEWLSKTREIDGGLVTTPSGAAGLAGLLTATRDVSILSSLGLGKTSRVLIFATENAL